MCVVIAVLIDLLQSIDQLYFTLYCIKIYNEKLKTDPGSRVLVAYVIRGTSCQREITISEKLKRCILCSKVMVESSMKGFQLCSYLVSVLDAEVRNLNTCLAETVWNQQQAERD